MIRIIHRLAGCFIAFALGQLHLHAEDLDISALRGKKQDHPVSVLQRRFFSKAMRPDVGILFGIFLKEAYTTTASYGLRTDLFFDEWWGLEFEYFNTKISDSTDRKALNKLQYRELTWKPDQGDIRVTPDPEINAIHHVVDLSLIAAPFYGKMNLMDYLIIYSDLCIIGGLAQVSTDQGDKMALVLGLGQKFYFYKDWSLRIDFRDRIFKEKRADEDSNRNAYSIDLGVSYLFF